MAVDSNVLNAIMSNIAGLQSSSTSSLYSVDNQSDSSSSDAFSSVLDASLSSLSTKTQTSSLSLSTSTRTSQNVTQIKASESSTVSKSSTNESSSSSSKTQSTDSSSSSSSSSSTSTDNTSTDSTSDSSSSTSSTTDTSQTDSTTSDVSDNTEVTDDETVEEVDGLEEDALESTEDTTLDDLLEDISDTVKEELDLTDEELQDIMSTLGLTMVDLIDPQNLMKVYLEANGESDPAALLTDESLATGLTGLCEQVDNVIQEDVSEEDLQGILDQLEELKNQAGVTENEDGHSIAQSQDQNKDLNQIPVEINQETAVTEVQADVQADSGSFTGEQGSANQQTNASGETNFSFGAASIQAATNESFMEQLASTSEAKEIVNQIVEQIKVNLNADSTSLEMILNPENLGKLHMTITSKDEVMTARIVAETEAAKQAIESGLEELKNALNEQGLKVDAVEVTVGSFEFQNNSESNGANQSQEDENSNGKIGKLRMGEDLEDYEDETVEDIEASSIDPTGKGSQLDLSV